MKRNITIIVISALVFFGCKSTEPFVDQKLAEMPKHYLTITDSSEILDPDWRVHFTDKHLIALIDSALLYNLDMRRVVQQIEMSKSGLTYAKGLSLPFVAGVGSAGVQRFGFYTMDGVGNYDTNFSPNVSGDQYMRRDLPDMLLGFQASWEIDVWGKLKNKKKAALARYLSSIEAQKWLKTNVVAEVAYWYYELMAVHKEIEILDSTIYLQDRGLEIVKLQKQAGNLTEAAVNQFEAQLLSFKSKTYETYRYKVEVENHLNKILGRFPESITTSPLVVNEKSDFEIASGKPEDLLYRRPDIKQAEQILIASKADVLAAKAAFYPSLDIQALLGFRSFNPTFFINPASITYQLFGSLMAPVFNRSALKADLEFTKASQKEAFYNYQESMINAYVEVFEQSFTLDNLSKVISLKSQEVEQMNKAVYNSNQLFMTGRSNYLEVIIAQRDALDAQLELIQIEKMRRQAFVNLYRALGGA